MCPPQPPSGQWHRSNMGTILQCITQSPLLPFAAQFSRPNLGAPRTSQPTLGGFSGTYEERGTRGGEDGGVGHQGSTGGIYTPVIGSPELAARSNEINEALIGLGQEGPLMVIKTNEAIIVVIVIKFVK